MRFTINLVSHRLNVRGAAIIACIAAAAMGILLPSCSTTKEVSTKPAAAPKALTTTFRIMSFNTIHALKNKRDVARFAQWIKTIAPDVLALQEIDVPAEGKSGFDVPAELAKQAEMHQFFGMARYWNGFNSGNALFSIYPIVSQRVESLPVGKGKVRRSLAYGVVDLGLRSVAFASTELDDQSAAEREWQVKAIFHLAQRDSEFPLVVCGMFNESVSGKIASVMMKQFLLANLLDEKLSAAEQQIYAVRDSVLKPIAVERYPYDGTRTDAVVATFQISQ